MQLASVYFNLTTACNLRCHHCFIEAGLPRPNELTTSELVSILKDIAAIGTEKMTFTGGEPLIRTDFLDLARYAASLKGNGIDQLVLVTNAMLIDKKIAAEIARLFDKVNVSIDGVEAVHDAIRGKGSFWQAIRGLRLLVKAGIEPTVFITRTKQNADTLNELMQMLYLNEGIYSFKIRSLWQFGRALEQFDLETEPAPSTFENDLNDLAGPLGYSLNIHPDGDIYPCHLLRFPEFVAGNVRKESLAEIYYESVIFRVLRSWGINCCQQVKHPRDILAAKLFEQKFLQTG